MNVGDLSLEQFAAELAGQGVAIRWGPFTSRIVSRLPELAAPIHLLYADFPIEPPGGICDFHVLVQPRSPRLPWANGRVEFLLEGEPLYEPFGRRFSLPMLEWGLNWCVYGHAHNFLVVHAAAVECMGQVLLLPGGSGAGKSTLSAALVHAGWRLLSDELAVLNPADGRILPLARPVSLKNAAIGLIRDFAPAAVLGPSASDTRKGTIAHMKPPSSSVRRAHDAASPRWVVLPSFAEGAPLRLTPISKATAFMGLAEHALNYEVLGTSGFRTLVRLIDSCECYRLTYGAFEEAVTALDDLALEAPSRRRRAATGA
jgi:HprK-related kinase A